MTFVEATLPGERNRDMISIPERNEATPYFFTYIDRVPSNDIVGLLATQIDQSLITLRDISEKDSLYRYAPNKWSVRQVLNHVTDTERTFVFRSFWFARGFDSPLPSFDQVVAASNAGADDRPWNNHVEEFRLTRLATHMFFTNLPSTGWDRSGTASDMPFTVRAMAFFIAGHFDHHMAILRERYLTAIPRSS